MQHRLVSFIQDILISVHENIRDLSERKNFAAPEEQTHLDAKLHAYQEILAIIRYSADEFDIPRDDIGI